MSTEIPIAASEFIAQFCRAQLISTADFHLARRLAELLGERRDEVILAFALASRELRLGSVCLELSTAQQLRPSEIDADFSDLELPWPAPDIWLAMVRESPAVAQPGEDAKACRMVGDWLYLERYYQEEQQVAQALRARARLEASPPQAVPPSNDPDQDAAVAAAVSQQTTVITGGPGTGKTTTVGRILDIIADPKQPKLVALAAPTGKAAAGLQAAVGRELPGIELSHQTLHKLLGAVPGTARLKYDETNPLPHDIVIVDETSMISLAMMAALLNAVKDDTKLIFLGDADQLASVEAGAVLADLVANPELFSASAGAVTRLHKNWRSEAEIPELATAIREGSPEEALTLLHDSTAISMLDYTGTETLLDYPQLQDQILTAGHAMVTAAAAGDGTAALAALGSHRVLCAHHLGNYGVSVWNTRLRAALADVLPAGEGHYLGQPLLITKNSGEVFNGDVAVVIRQDDQLVAQVDRAGAELRLDPYLISEAVELFAMTIHKSQGAQFDTVTLVLPPIGSPLLTRELCYTAVTRAKSGLRILGSEEQFAQAVLTPARRASRLGSS